jgi:tripartite-type tricarboxylate transporter receptor subunit TctC
MNAKESGGSGSTLAGALLGSLALSLAGSAWAQGAPAYPNKPIRLVVPYLAGASSNDVLARAFGPRLSSAIGQQVLVENKPGANGNTGSDFVAKAPADGYTLLIGVNGPIGISPSVYPKLPYDPVRDFAPVAMIASVPYVMLVKPDVPANSIKELVALAKSRPGKMNYASTGIGSTPHLCSAMFAVATDIDIMHIPYKGGAAIHTDMLGGQPIEIHCSGIIGSIGVFKTGKMRALAITSAKRSPLLPDLPTMQEAGVPGFEAASWAALLAPGKTPPPIVNFLAAETTKILQSAEFGDFLRKQGSAPTVMSPAEVGEYIKVEIAKWAKVVKATGIEVQ